jgi:hypothetical protein
MSSRIGTIASTDDSRSSGNILDIGLSLFGENHYNHPYKIASQYPEEDRMSDNSKTGERIGEGLIRIGAMTQDQVDEVLKIQNGGDKRLFGEIAIELGYIDDRAIKDYLDRKG